MTIGEIIGKNIIDYRTKLGFTQEHLANYLGTDRSTISKYENNEREISIIYLNKLSDLFGIEVEDLIEENSTKKNANLAFAFRSNGFLDEDIQSIGAFQKIVKKYLQMKDIQDRHE